MVEFSSHVPFQGQPRPGAERLTADQVSQQLEMAVLQGVQQENLQILALSQRVEILEAKLNQRRRLAGILSKLNPNPLRLKISDLMDRKPGTSGAVLTGSMCVTIFVSNYLTDPDFAQKAHLGAFVFMTTLGTAFGAGIFKLGQVGEEIAANRNSLSISPITNIDS